MSNRPDPIAAADKDALTISHALMTLGHAALAYTDAQTKTPGISRIAFGRAPDGTPMTLISSLAPHYAALQSFPDCAVLLGEPGDKGDPLTHPRLMIRARANFVAVDDPSRAALRDHWLTTHPKAKLYIDFADFALVRLIPTEALLNAGFGRAFRITAQQMHI